jgi:HEAT repeat protein
MERLVSNALFGAEYMDRALTIVGQNPRARRAVRLLFRDVNRGSIGGFAKRSQLAPEIVTEVLELCIAHPLMKADALRCATQIDHPGARGLVENYATSPDAQLRAIAAERIGAFGIETLRPALEALCKDADGEVRLAALRGRKKLGPRNTDAALVDLLADPHTAVRSFALRELRDRTNAAINRHLLTCLTDPDQGVRRDAALALNNRAREGRGEIERGLNKLLDHADAHIVLMALKYLRKPENAKILALLNHPDRLVREFALQKLSLGRPDTPRVPDEQLLRLLDDSDRDVRSRAVGLARTHEVGLKLIEMLSTEKDRRMLGTIRQNLQSMVSADHTRGDHRLVQILRVSASEEHATVRHRLFVYGAIHSMRNQKFTVKLSEVKDLIDGDDQKVRKQALYCLSSATLSGPHYAFALALIDDDDQWVSHTAAQKIATKLYRRDRQRFGQLLKHRHQHVRALITNDLSTLGLKHGEKNLAPTFVDQLKDEYYAVRYYALLGLGTHGSHEHVRVVAPFLDSEDKDEYRGAIFGLGRLLGRPRSLNPSRRDLQQERIALQAWWREHRDDPKYRAR